MIEKELRKRDDENREQYLWRVHNSIIKTGRASWKQITQFVNSQLVEDESEYLGESAYRKSCQYADLFYHNVFSRENNKSGEIDKQILELKKERIKLSDERVEMNRLLRMMARREALLEYIKKVFSDTEPYREECHSSKKYGDNDLLVHLTDIHTGIIIKNHFNEFDTEILRDRMDVFLSEIAKIANQQKSENCYLVIGETISGLIHPDLRVQTNENIIEQFRSACLEISYMIKRLSELFNIVNVYVTPGNHSRLTSNKNESIKGENLDILLPDFIKAKLQNYKNVVVHDNNFDQYIASFNIRGNFVVAAHGDKDTVSSARDNFTKMFGEKPDIILLGHLHHTSIKTDTNTKIIQTGCFSGSDNFSLDNRLHTDPEQTVTVVDNNGVRCIYPINLNTRKKGGQNEE